MDEMPFNCHEKDIFIRLGVVLGFYGSLHP